MEKSITINEIGKIIYQFRGKQVMLDSDLALLYEVETKILNKAVKRNINRFPQDFMFRLTKNESESLRFQIGTSKRGGRRYPPYAFTEHGILMLSSVLNSKRAIEVNIQIMRTFVQLRRHALNVIELKRFLGIVRRDLGELKFFVLDPPSEIHGPLFLTQIQRQESVSPESRPLRLDEYENSMMLVEGFPNSNILYSADVVEVAGPILTKVLEKVYLEKVDGCKERAEK